MYAQVYVNHPTQSAEPLTYLIPPELILKVKNRSLAVVPFRAQKIWGIVAKISRSAKARKFNQPWRKVNQVISAGPVVNDYQWQLADWLVDYYGCSMSTALFTILPHEPPKFFSQLSFDQLPKAQVNRHFQAKWISIHDWARRSKYYQLAIEKVQKIPGQILLIVPTLEKIGHWQRIFPQAVGYDRTNSPDHNLTTYRSVSSNQEALVIGTRSALFLPFFNLRLILCENPFHPAMTEERQPGYQVWQVALSLAKIHRGSVIFTDESIGPILPHIKQHEISQASPKPSLIIKAVPARLREEDYLIETIQSVINQLGTILIFSPHQSETTYEALKKINHSIGRYDAGHRSINNYKVVIATQQIFDLDCSFDQSYIWGITQRLAIPDPLQTEQVYHLIKKVEARTIRRLTILTQRPDYHFFSFLSQPKAALNYFLTSRRDLPAQPFARNIKITCLQPFELSVPNRPDGQKLKSYFIDGRWQIVIPTPLSFSTDRLIRSLKIPPQSKIVVDPLVLL